MSLSSNNSQNLKHVIAENYIIMKALRRMDVTQVERFVFGVGEKRRKEWNLYILVHR